MVLLVGDRARNDLVYAEYHGVRILENLFNSRMRY